jgi:hypothetical protein
MDTAENICTEGVSRIGAVKLPEGVRVVILEDGRIIEAEEVTPVA